MTSKEAEMYYNQAMAFLGQEDVIKSLEFFDKAISVDETYLPAWNNKGVALLNLERYEESLKCFQQVINLNPMDTMAIYNKGYALLMIGEYQLSVDTIELFLKRFSQKNDFYKFALYLQAKGFYHLKNYEYAEVLVRKAIKKDKNFKEALDLLILILKDKDSEKS